MIPALYLTIAFRRCRQPWTFAVFVSSPTAFDETSFLTNGISMLAPPVEKSRGQMFHVHFTRAQGHIIGRDTNVPGRCKPNLLELCGLSFPRFGTSEY